MKKYLSFFRLRFLHGLQYRTAAVSGIVTQFVWGAMEIFTVPGFLSGGSYVISHDLSGAVDLRLASAGVSGPHRPGSGRWSCLIPSPRAIWPTSSAVPCASIICGMSGVWPSVCQRRCCAVCRFSSAALLLPKPYGLTLPSHHGTWFLPYFPWFWRCHRHCA